MEPKAQSSVLIHCLHLETDRLLKLRASDWKEITQQAVLHGIAPLLYYRLHNLPTGMNVPQAILQQLRGIYLHTMAKNMLLWKELSNLLEALRNESIPVIPLKGAHLAEAIYGNIALRPMGDIDLLIRRQDLPRVESLLHALGYECPERCLVKREWYMQHYYHLPRHKGNQGILLEVHWNLTKPLNRFQIDIDGVWKRAKDGTIANVEVLVMSPEDLIWSLCFHACKHRLGFGLMSLFDIAETIDHFRNKIDWGLLVDLANTQGIGHYVLFCILLTRRMLGVEIPEDCLIQLDRGKYTTELLDVTERYLTQRAITSIDLGVTMVNVLIAENRCKKVIAILKGVFPPVEELQEIYKLQERSRIIYLYYIHRILDLIWRRGSTMLRLLLGFRVEREAFDQERMRATITYFLNTK